MNTSERIIALRKCEAQLDRSAFKVLFALAFKAETATGLSKQTGIAEKSVLNVLYGLLQYKLAIQSDTAHKMYMWNSELSAADFMDICIARRARQEAPRGIGAKKEPASTSRI